MSKKLKFYSIKNILTKLAHYNVIFGERSNGKTYSVLEYGLQKYFDTGEQMAIVRRWEEDFVGANSARTCFDSLTKNANGENVIHKMSGGKYTGVTYYSGRFYLTTLNDEGKDVRTDECVAVAFAISAWEHYKSGSFPHITTILFDEFMTRGRYLVNEFILFQNLLSTIIRQRNDVTIFMCANTVNKYACPYFAEMGLHRVKEMKQGEIDVYTYGDSGLLVAVEFSDSPSKSKPSDVYFAFNNPRLQMITGKGNVWEMDIYPHCPTKYAPRDILFTFFILFDSEILQGEIVLKEDLYFIFIHRKTTPLKDETNDLIYSQEYNARPNYRRNILSWTYKIEGKIAELFRTDKVFYQDNEVGEIMRNYLQWCKAN